MAATYTKLRSGEWGVRIPAGYLTAVHVGDEVEVLKRDGSRKTEKVAKIIWTGSDGTVLLAIQQQTRRGQGGWRNADGSPSTRRNGDYFARRDGSFHCTRPGCWCGGFDSE